MIIRNANVEAYRDRTGRYTLFNEAIDHLATIRYGKEWEIPVSRYKPRLIPDKKSNASIDETLYAADLIRSERPSAIITQVEYTANEAWFGAAKPFDLNICEDDWDFAYSLSNTIYDKQTISVQKLMNVLDIFCTAAATGNINCYVHSLKTFKIRDLNSKMWDVGDNVLWSRYVSGCLNFNEHLPNKEDGLYVILVDTEVLRHLKLPDDDPALESIEAVREELIEAAKANVYVTPGNNKAKLIRSVSKRTGITQKQARELVNNIPLQNWSIRGPRKAEYKFDDKDVHKGQKIINNNTAKYE